MNDLQICIQNYLNYCRYQKRLDEKTLKAYRIDLRQFCEQTHNSNPVELNATIIENYITKLHQQYTPKTVKRKIAS